MADYLDSIAADAQLLAELWEKVWFDLQNTEMALTELEHEQVMDKLGKVFPQFSRECRGMNRRVYGRLETFYHSLSSAIGGRVNSNFHDDFSFHLASLIRARDHAKEYVTSRLPEFDSPFLLNQAGGSKVIRDGQHLIEVLYKEAAEINALAKQYRANGIGTN